MGVRVVGYKREVFTARLTFIWVVKERGGGRLGRGGGFTLYALYFFINLLNAL